MSGRCKTTINVGNDKALALIKKEFGTDESVLRSILIKGFDGMGADGTYIPNKTFLDWYKDNYDSEFVASEHDAKETAEIYKQFNRSFGGRVSDTAYGSDENSINTNYTTDNARYDGYSLIAGTILNIHTQMKFEGAGDGKDHRGDRSYYNDAATYLTKFELFSRILGKDPTDDEYAELNEELNNRKGSIIDFFYEKFGEEHLTPQDRNLIAACDEMINHPNEYFSHVWGDPRLNSLKIKKDTTDDDVTNNYDDDVVIESRSNVDGKAAYEMMNKVDSKTSAEDIDDDLKIYLYTLPKLSSTEKIDDVYPTQTNSLFGLTEYIDADNVVNVLTAKLNNCLNIDDMADRIETFAILNDEYAGLIKFAEDIRNNPDLAQKAWIQFGNNIIPKSQVVQENDEAKSQRTNKRADSKTVLIDNLYNAVRHTTLDVDAISAETQRFNVFNRFKDKKNQEALNGLFTLTRDQINNSNLRTATVSDILEDYSDVIRMYYPIIKDSHIEAYLRDVKKDANGVPIETPYDRLNKLNTIIALTIEAASETLRNKDNITLDAEEKENRNRDLKKAYALIDVHRRHLKDPKRRDLTHRELDQLKNLGVDLDSNYKTYKDDPEYTNKDEIDKIRKEDYVSTKQTQAIATLAAMFDKYIASDISIDSYNADKARSSDKNDSDRIMQIKRAIENPDILKLYGEQWKKDVSLKYNNFIIEQDGSKGLFRINKKTGEWEVTEYAQELLNTQRFDGVVNNDAYDSATYSRMQQSDYITAAYTAFFHPAMSMEQESSSVQYGQYFMRTPSDAPKNYDPVAPKYSYKDSKAGNLFIYSEEDKANLNKEVNEFISKRANENDVNDGDFAKRSMSDVEALSILEDLARGYNKSIAFGKKYDRFFEADKDGETYTIHIGEGKDEIRLGFSGTYDMKHHILNDVKYLGVIGNSRGNTLFLNKLKKRIEPVIAEKKKLKPHVNKEHTIFKQYRNAFKQELLAAEVALHKYFDFNNDGSVVLNTTGPRAGKAKFKDRFTLNKNGLPEDDLNMNGIDNYHYKLDKNHKVQFFDKDGNLLGNVFHSNRFTLDVNGSEKNYGEEAIIDAFGNILYGGLRAVTDGDKAVDINITKDQQDKLDAHIADYIDEMCQQAYNTILDYGNFIKGTKVDFEHAAEFITNTNLMYYTFDDLYEGNSKFYGSAQDFLKRAKEAQAGGKSYGMTNYSQALDAKKIDTELSLADFKTITKDPTSGKYLTTVFNIPRRNKFTAVTVYNTITTDESNIVRLAKQWNHNMGVPFTEKTLKDTMAYKVLKRNHSGLKANDAQSYITFDEWVRRIAGRGQLSQYKPLIDAILDESKPVDANKLNQFVQEQKNFYFDLYFDNDNGVIVPRQIKNSEFVLIPRFIKGTGLYDVYKAMKDHGIDQINTRETTKAGKSGVLTLWDNEGKLTGLDHFNENCEQFSQEYDYSNLYTQQETVHHVNTDNKLAVQICKKIVDNVVESSKKAFDHKQRFFKAYSAKIQRSFYSLCDELEIPYNDNGVKLNSFGDISGVNYDKLFNRLKEEALRGGVDKNMIDYFTPRENGITKVLSINGMSTINTVMPMYQPNMSAKAQSVINAVFNSAITKQKVNGFHCAQITNVGFGYNKNQIIRDNRLRYHSRYDESSGKEVDSNDIEIAMTYSAFGINVNDQHYKQLRKESIAEAREESKARDLELSNSQTDKFNNKCKGINKGKNKEPKYTPWTEDEIQIRAKDIFDKKIIAELKEEGLDRVIAYRIPTEGKQSMAIARIAYFLDDTYDSTIVVPNEWVAQTGSDFDIDSVYGIQNRIYKDFDGKVRKIQYYDKPTRELYNDYVARKIKSQLNSKGGTQKTFDKVSLMTNKDINTFTAGYWVKKQEFYLRNKLTDDESKFLEGANKKARAEELTPDEKYDMIHNVIYSLDLPVDSRDRLEEYSDVRRQLENFISDKYADLTYDEDFKEIGDEFVKSEIKVKDFKQKLQDLRDKNIEAFAEDAGFLNYKTWEENFKDNPDNINANTNEALDNNMFEQMIGILGDPSQTEENLSSSTFANITGKVSDHDIELVRNSIEKGDYNFDKLKLDTPFKDWPALQQVTVAGNAANIANLRNNRSPYNFFNQASYMNDVMSGARLKAFSVTRDTFCSVCNTVRPYLGKDYQVIVKYADGKTIKHDKLGWSENNRNVDGYLITAYSSQTSAHAFDAVKEGAIPNVNDFTFAVYKLFPEIGSNYTTAVSFIMQPGITRIVNEYQKINSVFNDNREDNAIHNAIRSIAKDLDVTVPYGTIDDAPIHNIIKALRVTKITESKNNEKTGKTEKIEKDFGTIFKELFPTSNGISLKAQDIASVPFDVEKQLRRNWSDKDIKSLDGFAKAKMLAYDLCTILQFNRLNKIANKVTDIARVANPDKFGAKQTIWQNKKIFRDISKICSEFTYPKDAPYTQGVLVVPAAKNEQFKHKYTTKVYKLTEEQKKLGATVDNIDINTDIIYKPDGNMLTDEKGKPLKANYKVQEVNETVGTIPILEAIYPGISEGLDKYIQNSSTKDGRAYFSRYSTLNSFLRFATATSIKAARPFFKTESNEFVNLVNGIDEVFDKTNYYKKELDEKTYNEVRDYIIGAFYNSIDMLTKHVNSVTKNHIHQSFKPVKNSNKADEIRRIYGFGSRPDLKVLRNGEYVKFTVKNFNKPTKAEVAEWESFSPAQKVTWLKENMQDPEIFGVLDTTLFYGGDNSKSRGRQFINYTEDSMNIDAVRDMFERAISNKNPLIADAALDLIKYSFIVEGSRPSSRGITDVIRDTALIKDLRKPYLMAGRDNSIMDQIDSIFVDGKYDDPSIKRDLYESFVRSHINNDFIPHAKIKKEQVDTYDDSGNAVGKVWVDQLIPDSDGIIKIDSNNFDKLKKHKIGIVGATPHDLTLNEYVVLRKNKKDTLYKIEAINTPNDAMVVLYPLNKLETNEYGIWSLNEQNNEHYSKEYYIKRLNELEEGLNEADKTLIKKEDYTYKPYEEYVPESKSVKFNLNKPTDDGKTFESSSFKTITKKITDFYSNPNNYLNDLYITAPVLKKYIKNYGIENGQTQRIDVKGKDKNGNEIIKDSYNVRIFKINLDNIAKKYAGKNRKDIPENIKKRYGDIIEEKLKFAGNGVIREDTSVSESAFDDVFVVTRIGGGRKSTITEAPDKTTEDGPIENDGITDDTPRKENLELENIRIKKERQIAYNLYSYIRDIQDKDSVAKSTISALNRLDISTFNASIDTNTNVVIHAGAQYIHKTANNILDTIEHFAVVEQPDGSRRFVSITDKVVLDRIKNDDNLRIKFLDTIEKARAIVNRFKMIRTSELQSNDKTINDALTIIKNDLTTLESSELIENAYLKYGNDYLQSQSDNILIQQKLLNVLDGYYSTSMVNSWFGDLQDVSNPLIQIATKRAMRNIRAREFETRDYMLNFDKKWDTIFAKASANGNHLSLDDIITHDGSLKQRYTKVYFADYFKLNDELTEAKILHGEYSIEAAWAQLRKNEWLADNTEQRVRNLTDEEFFGNEYDKWQSDFAKLSEKKYINEALSSNAFADRKKLKEEFKKLKKEHDISREDYIKREIKRDKSRNTSYYAQRNALVRRILEKAPDVYVEYKKHQDELNRLINLRTEIVSDELENKIDEEMKAIAKLKSNYTYDADGFPTSKINYKENDSRLSKDPEIRHQQLANTELAASELNEFLDNNGWISHTFFEVSNKDTFADDLQKRLDVLAQYEQKDRYGHLKQSRSSLIKEYKDYAEAISWLNKNAKLDFTSGTANEVNNILNFFYHNQHLLPKDFQNTIYFNSEKELSKYMDEHPEYVASSNEWNDIINQATIDGQFDAKTGFHLSTAKGFSYMWGQMLLQRLFKQAFNILQGSKETRSYYRAILNNHKGVTDKYGVVDARQFTDEEISRIKNRQDFDYGNRQTNTGADTKMMNSAGKPTVVYTDEFYKGLSAGGVDNVKHLKLVANFNKFILPFWDPENNRINTSRMSTDELIKLDKFLTTLSRLSSKKNATKEAKEAAKKFREKNATYAYTDEAKANFNAEREAAYSKGLKYYSIWRQVNEEAIEGQAENVPRRILYAHVEPKKEVEDQFIDYDKQWAIEFMDAMYETTNTDYWWEARKAKQKEDSDYRHDHPEEAAAGKVHIFDDWYEKNTVFNPYKHQREPLMCWTTRRMVNENFATWLPKGSQLESQLKQRYKNDAWHDGNQGTMLGLNYKINPNKDEYNNHLILNDSQKELYDLIKNVIDTFVKDPRAQAYTRNGRLPATIDPSHNIKGNFVKQIGKAACDLFGIGESKIVDNDQSNVGYDTNQYAMPMLELFKGKQLEKVNLQYPNKEDFDDTHEGKQAYWKALDDYHKKKREQDEEDIKTHASMINHDWRNVLKQFIIQAGRYNAIADEKLDLVYAREMLQRDYIYEKNPITGQFKYNKQMSSPGNPQYLTTRDENLINEYDNWLKRLVLDIWKEPTEQKLNRFAGSIQNLTSNMYMMLNIRGGISNITTGLTNIAAEVFAAEHFDKASWGFSQKQYFSNINDFIKHMYDDKSDTLVGGLLKFMNVVDFDELNGQIKVTNEKNTATKLRSLSFGTNSMGEHYMQNSAMLAMMDSHRLIPTPDFEQKGRPKYTLMTAAEYAMHKEGIELMKYLDKNAQEEWTDFIEDITYNPEHFRKYAWFRHDAIEDFALQHLSIKDARELGKKRSEIYKKAIKEFTNDNNQKLYDQFELGNDGYVHFKKGSIMDQLNVKRDGRNISDAYLLLGGFKQRVISVNKKIHGFYDRMARAQIEKTLAGSLIMQYHKHILPGFLKAYRRQGYFNEERGTIEKGRYTALWDFLRIPFDTIKVKAGLNEDQVDTLKGIQNLFKNITNIISIYRTAWYLLPPTEKANMARNLGFAGGIMTGLFGALAVNLIMNNANQNSVALNLALYEFDRLATESGQFNPIQFQTQANTLWSQPVAAMSIVNDLENVMGEFASILIQGEDYDGTYHSGMYAGQNKLGVFVGRRIPIYRQYQALEGLSKNNSAYHIGDNMLTFFGANPKAIANYIKGEDE